MISNKTLKPNERRTKRAWHSHPGMWRFSTVKLLVVFKLLSYVLRSIQIDTEVLCAAISVYLLLGLIWALAYALLAQLSPDSFAFAANPHSSGRMDRFNAFYFSFVTLSTVGFGDVTPVSRLARTLAVMEAVTGTFYVAILIARLVAMYVPASRLPAQDESRRP